MRRSGAGERRMKAELMTEMSARKKEEDGKGGRRRLGE